MSKDLLQQSNEQESTHCHFTAVRCEPSMIIDTLSQHASYFWTMYLLQHVVRADTDTGEPDSSDRIVNRQRVQLKGWKWVCLAKARVATNHTNLELTEHLPSPDGEDPTRSQRGLAQCTDPPITTQ